MSEVPDDAVSEFKLTFFKDLIVIDIERKNFAIFDVISDLPTDTSLVM